MTEYNLILQKYILDVQLHIELLKNTHPRADVIINYNLSVAIDHLLIARQRILMASEEARLQETKRLEEILPEL